MPKTPFLFGKENKKQKTAPPAPNPERLSYVLGWRFARRLLGGSRTYGNGLREGGGRASGEDYSAQRRAASHDYFNVQVISLIWFIGFLRYILSFEIFLIRLTC